MTLIGVDMNATRARAVHGTLAGPAALALDGNHPELPLALSLEDRTPVVGRAGVALCRKTAHLACLDFLPHLGEAKLWTAGRHRLDATAALSLICQHLQPRFARASGIVLALPPYLSEPQTAQAVHAAEKARWRVLGMVPTAVAATLAAQDHLPWSGLAIVVDVDGHALTWSAVALGEERARLADVRNTPRLALGNWLRALLDGVSKRCVRMSRRDPRACADTEQSLFEQLWSVVESGPRGGIVELNIQSPQFCQNLMLPAEELAGYAVPLVEQAAADLQDYLTATASLGPAAVLVLTAAAGRLPGLAQALGQCVQGPAVRPVLTDSDFGEGLLDERSASSAHVLDDDAVARAAFDLAGRMHRGDVAGGHLLEVPVAAGGRVAADNGPARLHFRGKDHVLKGPSFTMGRDPACDLVFETELYPSVSARHCEVLREKTGYVLRDRSRHGTIVNDRAVSGQVALRPGDWIRLGPEGPLLRFLGQSGDPFRLVTTA
jgi:hypothetical protein